MANHLSYFELLATARIGMQSVSVCYLHRGLIYEFYAALCIDYNEFSRFSQTLTYKKNMFPCFNFHYFFLYHDLQLAL